VNVDPRRFRSTLGPRNGHECSNWSGSLSERDSSVAPMPAHAVKFGPYLLGRRSGGRSAGQRRAASTSYVPRDGGGCDGPVHTHSSLPHFDDFNLASAWSVRSRPQWAAAVAIFATPCTSALVCVTVERYTPEFGTLGLVPVWAHGRGHLRLTTTESRLGRIIDRAVLAPTANHPIWAFVRSSSCSRRSTRQFTVHRRLR